MQGRQDLSIFGTKAADSHIESLKSYEQAVWNSGDAQGETQRDT